MVITPNLHEAIISKKLNLINITRLELENKVKCIYIHKSTNGGGQLLICTAGSGWYQEEGKDAISLVPGMVITIPANVKHWHGAKKDSWFSHIAVEVPGEDTENVWLESVSDEEYNNL